MANLSLADRAVVSALFQSDESRDRSGFAALTKADLIAAVNGLDDYLETNKVAMNTAIPQPARGALTTKQKARLLVYVIQRRYQVEV